MVAKKCSKQKLFQDRKSSKDDRVKVTKSSINNNQGYEKESTRYWCVCQQTNKIQITDM